MQPPIRHLEAHTVGCAMDGARVPPAVNGDTNTGRSTGFDSLLDLGGLTWYISPSAIPWINGGTPFRSQASDEAGWFALVSSKHSECRNRPPLSMEFLMAFKRACLSGQSARRAQLQKIPSPRLNSSPPSIKVMPRPSSQSRRQRNSSLTSPLFHWRPRVSSPLTSEVTFQASMRNGPYLRNRLQVSLRS
ncbi:hypothetical protein H4Q26_006450 [Puccinia striiformis f. sp. tritici PST-130]|nr:hypothetical protein H4Q26_006450 [Puccinia striiformis f. sp. tritici PST-130]